MAISGYGFFLENYLSFSHRPVLQQAVKKQKLKLEEKMMLQKLGTKLQVLIEQAGEDKQKKVNFQNVIDNPPETDVVRLGEIMAELSKTGSSLDSVIMTVQSRITKEVE